MKMFMLFLFAMVLSFITIAQSNIEDPQTHIPFQGIIKNPDGTPLENTPTYMRFTIHRDTPDGSIEYCENQALTTDATGRINAAIGSGIVIVGNYANIDWDGGIKYLSVERSLSSPNGPYSVLESNQMLSVPYAMHTRNVSVNVSETGDTLRIGNGPGIIIPGISAANP